MKYLKPYHINESIDKGKDELIAFTQKNQSEIDSILSILVDDHYLEAEGEYTSIDYTIQFGNIVHLKEFGFYSGTLCDEKVLEDCRKVARKLSDMGLLTYVGIMNNYEFNQSQSEHCVNTDMEVLKGKVGASMLYLCYTLSN